MNKDEFYVGYIPYNSPRTKSFLTKFLIIIGLVIMIGALTFAISQQQFKNGTFELGTISMIEGVLHASPYPILRVNTAKGLTKDVLLVGYGKAGAVGVLKEMADSLDLEGLSIQLKGTLIFSEGRTIFQLEPNSEGNFTLLGQTDQKLTQKTLGEIELSGEIIDPKCYFGVMKPGRGKTHRSCAIRCISGGIPPVFLTNDKEGNSEYYLITGLNGEAVNNRVLEYVGKPSRIMGELIDLGDWKQIKIDCSKIHELSTPSDIY